MARKDQGKSKHQGMEDQGTERYRTTCRVEFRPVDRNQGFAISRDMAREWPRYCRKVYWTKMVQNGHFDHFGQNDLLPNWILAFARPK